MVRNGLLFACFCLLLSACAPTNGGMPTLMALPSLTASPESTEMATLVPSVTSTLIPDTLTPVPPKITPLPIIPTFTPTFDVRTIVTATPAPKAECPQENPEISLAFQTAWPSPDDILDYLNLGGSLNKLSGELGKKAVDWGKIADLTDEGSMDVVFVDFLAGNLFVYGCKNGKYISLLEFDGTQGMVRLGDVVDLNKDGILDFIVTNYERGAFSSISLFEWDGLKFHSLIDVKSAENVLPSWESDWVGGTDFHYKIIDVNKDGLDEIVAIDKPLHGDPAFYAGGLPLRDETITLGWNGKIFAIIKQEYTLPQYLGFNS